MALRELQKIDTIPPIPQFPHSTHAYHSKRNHSRRGKQDLDIPAQTQHVSSNGCPTSTYMISMGADCKPAYQATRSPNTDRFPCKHSSTRNKNHVSHTGGQPCNPKHSRRPMDKANYPGTLGRRGPSTCSCTDCGRCRCSLDASPIRIPHRIGRLWRGSALRGEKRWIGR